MGNFPTVDVSQQQTEVGALKAWLRERVAEAGDSQESLARHFGVTTRTIRNALSDTAGFGGVTTYLLIRMYGGVTFDAPTAGLTITDLLEEIDAKVEALIQADLTRTGQKRSAEDPHGIEHQVYDLLARAIHADPVLRRSTPESRGGSAP